MKHDTPDIIKRPLEEKDILSLKKNRSATYKKLGASILFFLLFVAAAYTFSNHPRFLMSPQKGAEGLEKVPIIVFCFFVVMMFIGIIRSLWKLSLIKGDFEEGEKLCGNAISKRGIQINKVPHLMLKFDKPRTVRIRPAHSDSPRIPKGEQVYVELASRSSIVFSLKYQDEEVFIPG